MIRIARYLKYFKKEVIVGPICKLIEAIFEVIVPLVMAQIIDVGIANGDREYVIKMGILMISLSMFGLAFSLTCQFFASRASQGFGTIVRNDMFRHINTLSFAEIDRIGTASLITRITNDVNQLQLAVAMLIRLVVRTPFLVIGSSVLAFIMDWQLGLILLMATVIVGIILWLVMFRSMPHFKTIQKKLDHASLVTRESLSGVRVIRAFSKQKNEEERFDDVNGELTRASVRIGRISALLNPLTFLVMNLAIVAVLWFGGFKVAIGGMTQGKIIIFVSYMTQILLAMIVTANVVVIFTKAAACANRVNEVFDLKPSVVEGTRTEGKEDAPKVEFRNVSFSYAGSEEKALEPFSFVAKKGETVGIIGGTGSGKSTLVNLIPRFYDVTEGEILVDGVNVREYCFDALREPIGIVPQKAVLFAGTIESNLKWGKKDATEEEMWRALEISQSAEFVRKLPQGLKTPVQQGGRNFSGGQKQRLTIARALVSEPKILILDDSASALDFATDAALRKALRESTDGITTFIVSQRASSVMHADKIVVLDDGQVMGIGTHDELLSSCEVYREICSTQFSVEEGTR